LAAGFDVEDLHFITFTVLFGGNPTTDFLGVVAGRGGRDDGPARLL